MPVSDTGQLREFTGAEVLAMNIRTMGVRDRSHGQETRELNQSTMRKSFRVAWARRHDFVELALGREKTWTDGGTVRLSRLLPDPVYGRHPDPNLDEIVATKVERMMGAGGAGIDDEEGTVEYPDCDIDLLFEHVPYDLEEDDAVYASGREYDRYVYFADADGDAEVYTMPGGGMHYIRADGVGLGNPEPHLRPLPFNVNVTRPVEMFSYTWERLPEDAFLPTSNLFARIYTGEGNEGSYLGRINSATFKGRPPGTVLFLKVKPTLLRSQRGAGRVWRLQYTFLFAPTGHTWLRYFDPTGAQSDWYFVGNGTAHHFADTLPDNYSIVTGKADLNKLFSVGA